MNIVVIGSCTDSSNLAKELNRRLHDSIVARVDLLKNIKQLVLQDMNLQTTENIGTYVGDVETFNFSKVKKKKKKQISETIESITKNIAALKAKDRILPLYRISTFDALTNSLPTGTYSFIKVYSGAINDDHISNMMCESNFISNAIFVTIKTPKDALLPITISEKTLEHIKKNAFAYISCDTIQDVFTSEVFQLLFDLNNNKEEPKVAEVVQLTQPEETQEVFEELADAA